MSKVGSSESKNTLYCSFCGKSQHGVRKLIAGPTVFICDECVELCMDIIREENTSSLVKSRDGIPAPKEIRKVLDGAGLRKLDPTAAPVSTALGVLGMPGMTAYIGLLEIGQPKPGETVVVAAASGAVGSVVGQVAKIKGCHAVGIAGGAEKCNFVTGELGFDCVDHRAPDFAKQLEAVCPKGIDIYFENVGGTVQQMVWPLLNDFARIPVCGLIAQYNATTPMPGPDMFSVLRKRLLLRGFIVSDFTAEQADFLRDVGEWVRTGRLKYREDIVDGLEKAPASFLGVLQGKNFGKMLVRIAT